MIHLHDRKAAERAVREYREKYWQPADGYWFDEEAALVAVDFFPKFCRLTEAEWAGQRFHLELWQAAQIIVPMFGWKNEDGTRRYTQVVVWVPRKNGKTMTAAGIGNLLLLGDGEYGGQGYAIATKKEQAEIVFEMAKQMANMSEGLSEYLVPLSTSLYCPKLVASFKPLSGIPRGNHGKGASFMIGDEMHEWDDDRLYTFISQGMGARRQPMEFMISTAGLAEGFGYEFWNSTKYLYENPDEDPETLVVIFAADPKADIYDPEIWAAANPNYGVSLKTKYMEKQARRAKRSARAEADFKRYHLNIWVGAADRWLSADKWKSCRGKLNWPDLETYLLGRKCYGGLDLASTRDFNALVWVFPPVGNDPRWYVLPRLWMPVGSEGELQAKERASHVNYTNWDRAGAMILTDGNAADHDLIGRTVLEDCEKFDVQGLGVDRHNAHKLVVELMDELAGQTNDDDEELVQYVTQGSISLNSPSKLLERLVVDEELAHGAHPVMRWMAGHAVVTTDAADNIKPDKKKSTQKIDGIAATVNALALAEGKYIEEKPSGINTDYMKAAS